MADEILTAEYVRDRLDYDHSTGTFTRRSSVGGVKIGSIAGSKHSKGYLVIKLRSKLYKAHRLAWLHFYGVYPESQIDHIDGDKANNRISNLRDVSAQINSRNRKIARADSSTGVLGVCYQQSCRKYQAVIHINGKRKHLGFFDDIADAAAVRQEAELVHYPEKP